MRPEEILHEAEKFNLRDEVFRAVRELKEKAPNLPLDSTYDIAWEQVKKLKRIK